MAIDYAEKHNQTPRQEGRSCRGGSQRVIGGLDMVRGGCRRCGS